MLTALALVGWSTTISGRTWWLVAAGVGLSIALVAVGLVSVGYGTGATAAVVGGAYVLTAGPLAAGEVHLRGLALLGDGAVGSVDGWAQLVGTHPAVAGAGAVLLAPVLVSLVAAGLGTSLALTSSRPGLPLVPALVALLVVLLTGPREPTSLVLQGGAFGVAAVMWTALRGARLEQDDARPGRRDPRAPAGRSGDGRRRRRRVGRPRGAADPQRTVLRSYVDGYDASARGHAAGRLPVYTKQRADFPGNVYARPLLRVFGAPEGLRLRFAVLDQYDGTSWHASDAAHLIAENSEDRYLRVSEDITSTAVGEPLAIAVRVLDEWDLPWVPTAGNLTSFEFSFADDQRFEQLRYNPALDAAVMTDRLTPSDDYAFTAVLGDDSLDRSMEPGTDLDPDTASWAGFLEEPLAAWAGNTRRPVPALLRFGERLREDGRYTDGAEPWTARYRAGHGVDRLGKGFVLTRPTAGNDEQYAATMALAASELGIPARVVVGATVPEGSVVRGRDVSAWVEVQVADGSWRTLPTEQFMGSTPPPREPPPAVPPVRDFPQPPQPDGPAPQPEPESPSADQDAETSTPQDEPRRWAWGLIGVLLVGAVPGIKLARRLHRLRAPRASTRYAGAWLELVDRARDLGIGVPAGLTRQAQARVMARNEDLAWTADRAVFGIDEPEPAAAEEYWGHVWAEATAMAAERPRWRRLWAPFNPASLRRP